jgi:hypothetical protein
MRFSIPHQLAKCKWVQGSLAAETIAIQFLPQGAVRRIDVPILATAPGDQSLRGVTRAADQPVP